MQSGASEIRIGNHSKPSRPRTQMVDDTGFGIALKCESKADGTIFVEVGRVSVV